MSVIAIDVGYVQGNDMQAFRFLVCIDKAKVVEVLQRHATQQAMRSGHAPRSPRLVACALVATVVCFLVPFKLSRDSQVLDAVEQPAHLKCSGAPARKGSSWLPGTAGTLKDLRADEKTVKTYVEKCILSPPTREQEVISAATRAGIVIPAGGKWLLSNTLAVATVLRHALASTLPIEVVYNGQEEYDETLVTQLEVSHCGRMLQLPTRNCHFSSCSAGFSLSTSQTVLYACTALLCADADNTCMLAADLQRRTHKALCKSWMHLPDSQANLMMASQLIWPSVRMRLFNQY